MELRTDVTGLKFGKVTPRWQEIQSLLATAAHIVYGVDNKEVYEKHGALELQFPLAVLQEIGQIKKGLGIAVEHRSQSTLTINAYHTWVIDQTGQEAKDRHDDQVMAMAAAAMLQYFDLLDPADTICIFKLGSERCGFIEGLIDPGMVARIMRLLHLEESKPAESFEALDVRRQNLRAVTST